MKSVYHFGTRKMKLLIVFSFSVFNLIKQKTKNEWRCDRLMGNVRTVASLIFKTSFANNCQLWLCHALFRDKFRLSDREDGMNITKPRRLFPVLQLVQ